MTPSSGSTTSGPDAAPAAGAGPVRVLVCDDSAFMRTAVAGLFAGEAGFAPVETARNAQEAVDKCVRLRPDVLVLDMDMPVMDGRQALAAVRRECRGLPGGAPAVIVYAGPSGGGAHDALQALREGAADAVALDAGVLSDGAGAVRGALLTRARALAAARTRGRGAPAASKGVSLAERRVDLIVIGASTGGPPVLEQMLAQLPPGLPCPIVVGVAMPAPFTKALSERLDAVCAVSIIHGEHGMPLHPGSACVVPGDRLGRVRALGRGPIRLELAEEAGSTPDALLASAARHVGAGALGVVLSGVDEGGPSGVMSGVRALLAAGGLVLAQDGASCVVDEMPRVAAVMGAVPMTPEHLARALASIGAGAQAAAA